MIPPIASISHHKPHHEQRERMAGQANAARDLCPIVVIRGPPLVQRALLQANSSILDRGDDQKARRRRQAWKSPNAGCLRHRRVPVGP
jgi:hypothetical protein